MIWNKSNEMEYSKTFIENIESTKHTLHPEDIKQKNI
jgi:hypothetical protein